MKKPFVKICCISSVSEAKLALKYGASALGLVGHMPSGPGVISDELIAEIVQTIPENIDTFLLTSETSAQKIIEHHAKVGTSTIQIVDELLDGSHEDIKKALPNVKIVQVLHVQDHRTLNEALELSKYVDGILLDSGNPSLKTKELGGTGRVHNWAVSKKIVEKSKAPVFLAGGLKLENVQNAIKTVQPFGIDLCSGVRTNGNLDAEKLKQFFGAIR